MGGDAEGRGRGSSSGEKLTTKGKALFSITSRNHKLQDRVGVFRHEKIVERLHPSSFRYKVESSGLVHSCPPKIATPNVPPRGQLQKDSRGVEELVKYMSDVPAYLQLLCRGNTNQERALNMGVLNWGNLQKWTDCRRSLSKQFDSDPSFVFHSSFRSSGSRNTGEMIVQPSLKPLICPPASEDSEKEDGQKRLPFHGTVIKNNLGEQCLPHIIEIGDSQTIFSEKFIFSTSDCSATDPCPLAQTVYSEPPNEDCRSSLDSAVSVSEVEAPGESYHSGMFSEDGKFKYQYSHIVHSCPLPSGISEDASSPDASDIAAQVTFQETSRFRCNLEQSDNFTSQTPRLMAKIGKKADFTMAKPKEALYGLSRVSRSSSFQEIEVRRPAKGAACQDGLGATDKATPASRSRRSPLRRMLDPLLKPRMSLRCPESVASSPASLVRRRLSFSDKSHAREEAGMNVSRYSFHKERTSSSCDQEARISTVPVRAKSHQRSKIQAIFRLVWKNDLPLFTFSTNDDDILVSTRKMPSSDKPGIECTYSFYSVCEKKRRIGGWRNQGNKSKRQELDSKVIGRMNVSHVPCSESGASNFSVGEFVLFGTEIWPCASETSKLLPESEIAAVVIRSPKDAVDDQGFLLHPKDHCSISGHQSSSKNIFTNCSIVVILPSEVHGFSEAGSPSPLVERWKSGGCCDCGGWDVGCALSILTENFQDTHTSMFNQFCSASSSTQRAVELVEGGIKKCPVFCLVPCNDGLFTVDYDNSISALQAFSICVAILHSRKHHAPSKLRNPLHMKNPAVAPAVGYGPYHPPLSPFGRA